MDRKEFRKARSSVANKTQKEKAIVRRLLPFLSKEAAIGFYMAMPSEADVGSFFLDDPCWKVCLPKVLDAFQMEFYAAGSLKKGAFGIWEPEETEVCIPDIVIVPLLGFHKTWRMGQGRGYYDRWLSLHPQVLRIGVAFDEQEGLFEVRPWDEPLDFIVTPSRVFKAEDFEDCQARRKGDFQGKSGKCLS